MKATGNSDLTLCTANVNITGLAPAQSNCQHNFTFPSARTAQLSAQLYVPLCTHFTSTAVNRFANDANSSGAVLFKKKLHKVGRYVHRLIKCQMSKTYPSSLRLNLSSSVWQQEQPRTKESLSKFTERQSRSLPHVRATLLRGLTAVYY